MIAMSIMITIMLTTAVITTTMKAALARNGSLWANIDPWALEAPTVASVGESGAALVGSYVTRPLFASALATSLDKRRRNNSPWVIRSNGTRTVTMK
jgi:hypothetical protein